MTHAGGGPARPTRDANDHAGNSPLAESRHASGAFSAAALEPGERPFTV